MRRRGRRGRCFLDRPMLCRRLRWRRRFGGTRRLRLRNTSARESNKSNDSKYLCDHKRERKKAEGLQSIQFRRHTERPRSTRNFSPGLERAGRLRYPLNGGPDSGMPEVGCGGFRRRFRPDETVRGQSNSRRHSQTGIQNTADQARHIRVIHIRSGVFRFSLVARTKIGLTSLW